MASNSGAMQLLSSRGLQNSGTGAMQLLGSLGVEHEELFSTTATEAALLDTISAVDDEV